MAKSLAEWKGNTLGHTIDLDNQSYDCVDLPKSWAEYLTGKSWQTSFCWGNAKDLYANAPDAYWDKLPLGNQPKLGDVVVMNGSIGGGYGHTGVVVGFDGQNITIIQQNTFTQQPAYLGTYGFNRSYITGYLRSKTPFEDGTGAGLQGFQRVASYAAKYRSAPNSGGELLQTFNGGDTYDFKGFVHGENVDGNDIWFVGKYTGGYVWSGAFSDTSTHDLADLTPAATLGGNQRQVGDSVMNYRSTALVAPDNVIKQFNPGEVLDFKGFVHGQSVDGNNIWFVGAYTGGYVWSGGFKDTGTHDLPDLTPASTGPSPTPAPDPTPNPTPVPVPPPTTGYTFTKDLACVTEVRPAAEGNFEHGNFPAKPTKVVIHDFGTKGRDTIDSTINHFQGKGVEVSAHFVVSGKRIVQMVSLQDRAWHAGPNGNGFVGIESDPAQDADTIASVQMVLKALALYYGYVLTPVKHSSIMATLCGDDINMDNYQIADPNKPTPTPDNTDLAARVKALEDELKKVVDFIKSIFKGFN